jgi:hypothetical protein
VAVDRASHRSASIVSVTEFVGVQECVECHKAPHEQWAATPHAKAYTDLKAKGDALNAQLVRRTVTGFGKFGGFTSEKVTPQLLNVQCEECHGAGRRHRDERKQIEFSKALIKHFPNRPLITPKVKMNTQFSATSCTQCHDPKSDPDFDLATAMEQVKHKDDPSPTAGAAAAPTKP